MKKYNEEYFTVIETKTGKKIADCGDEQDALMMISFDPKNRTYTRNKFLMGPVVDIEIPKALPTNEIVPVQPRSPKKLKLHRNKLKESDLEPVVV